MKETRATYFCVDLESSGPVPGIYDMISFGGVAVAPDAEGKLHLLDEQVYVELAPTSDRFVPEAMEVNGLDFKRLKREGLNRAEAMRRLTDWARALTVPGTEAVFVGHNAPFDWSFISYCYVAEGMANPFGYKALDTKALAGGVLGIHWLDTGKDVLAQRLGLPPEDMTQKHRADYDAYYQALVLKALLEYQA